MHTQKKPTGKRRYERPVGKLKKGDYHEKTAKIGFSGLSVYYNSNYKLKVTKINSICE